MPRLELYGLKLPEVMPGDDIARMIVEHAGKEGVGIRDKDIIVLTSKIISKALNKLYRSSEVRPSRKALSIGRRAGLDPVFVELVLKECNQVLLAVPFKELVDEGIIDLGRLCKDYKRAYELVKHYPVFFITLRDGMIWSDSGIDSSNHPPGIYSAPPRNMDKVAKDISNEIFRITGKKVAVVICDTELILSGSMDFARGSYGIRPVDNKFGEPDMYGKPKFGGVDCIAHELCSAAALLMRQTGEGIPAVIVRGLEYEWFEGGLRDVYSINIESAGKIFVKILKCTIKTLGLKHVIKLLLSIIK